MPKKIDFGSEIYTIIETDTFLDSDRSIKLTGEINYNEGTIEIEEKIGPQRKAHAMLHESFHFFLRTSGNEADINPERREDIIDMLSTATLLLIRRNPKLIEYIQSLPS